MSRGGLPVSIEERKRRLSLARAVAGAGGSATIFARRAGLTPSAAANWLRDNDADLHAQLTGTGRGKPLTAHQALVRLLLLKSVEGIRGGHKRLAAGLGLTSNTLSVFKNQWAPDGLEAAIADLLPEEGNGKSPLKCQLKSKLTQSVHGGVHG